MRLFLSLRQALVDSRAGLGARQAQLNGCVTKIHWSWAHASETDGDFSEFLRIFGGYVGGVIPDPIPNSEVKPSRADGTAWATVWESRTPPELTLKPRFFGSGVSF